MNIIDPVGKYTSSPFARGCLGLLCALLLVLCGCSTNPAKETSEDTAYGGLYSGSDEEKRTHEAARTAETAEEAIALGDKALYKGKYDQAVFQYVKAMELNGGDTATLNKIGDIQNKMGDYAHAGQAYQLSLNLDADNQHALEGLGLIQLRDRNYSDAKANLSHALTLKPDLWRAHNALGTIADLQGDYAVAQEHYRNSLLLQPNSQHVINNYGYSKYLSGDWNAALLEFRKAININPEFERAWYNIGLVYARQGKFDDALDAFDNVMSRPQAYNDIGYICMINGDYSLAESYYRKAIKLSSTYYKKAHENLEKMQRLKTRSSGTVSSRITEPAHTTDAVITAEKTGRSLHDTEIGNSGNTGVRVVGNSATINVIQPASRDSPDTTGESPKSADIQPSHTPAIVTPSRNTSNKPVIPAELPVTAELPGDSIVPAKPETTDGHTAVNESALEVSETEVITDSEYISSDANRVTGSSDNASGHERQITGSMEEQIEYREALLKLNKRQYADATSAFGQYLATYPGSKYADNASYWLGETYYLNHDYDQALEIFSNLVERYPQSPVLADTRLKIGYLHYEKESWLEARQELSHVVTEYPASDAAKLAKLRLKRMDREGR